MSATDTSGRCCRDPQLECPSHPTPVNRLRKYGASGLAHRARGKPSNHRYSSGYRNSVLSLVRENYSDFSPTFALEKLTELQIYQS
ncbi:hypothetical protein [Vibrio cyclitrophicus]|uniref:hypothetical protein n=1 Tax=Vibrio cyclitrophicus TaxID=47951 RepID=UPI001C06B842|nr:hypothetical protein [Vibrio cyclitrophicus]MBU2932643.1 hypothetical protein [Vibrio cyclitrophicus]